MAKRNKKKGQANFPLPIPLVILVLVLSGFALMYVCLQGRTEKLGREIKALEAARDNLRDQLVREQCEWARLQSPSALEQSLKAHGLVMTWPSRDQIVRIRYDGGRGSLQGLDGRPPSRLAGADRVAMND